MVPTMWASMVASEEMEVRPGVAAASVQRRIAPADAHEGGDPREISQGRPERILRRHRSRPRDESLSRGPAAQSSIRRPAGDRNVVELRDEQGNVVPQGEVGEIHIGGATIIREYFNNPEATAAARRGGFFTLGTWADSMKKATSASSTARRT